MPGTERDVLVERLARYPVQRYPVQHATTQFHLGSLLLNGGDAAGAVGVLRVARDVFAGAGLALEAAKAAVMLGIGLRSAGRLDEATVTFDAVADALAALDQPAERGAARYNLGLVRQDLGDHEGARAAWAAAEEAFLSAGRHAQAAAAARERGASLLAGGVPEAAVPLLAGAVELAERVHDELGAAVAANVLGLAQLAAGDPAAAVAALRHGLGFAPRSIRPPEHAMLQANLALAYERAQNLPRARLAARQALAVAQAAPPVRAQARELLQRCPGDAAADVLAVLDAEARPAWPAVLREELIRTSELPRGSRREVLHRFLDGILARPDDAYALAQGMFEVVLEVPPVAFDALVDAIAGACTGRPDAELQRLDAILGAAMARFAIPQWQRLAAALNAAAANAGVPVRWR